MDPRDCCLRTGERFGSLVHSIGDDWTRPTPCDDWDVRTLVNHVTYEQRWTPPLLRGSTIEEVGDVFEGDLLGDEPVGAWDRAGAEARDAIATVPLDRPIHLSSGDEPASEYLMQLFADCLIHGWDLARGIDADDRLDLELVTICAEWFADNEDEWRVAGMIGPAPQVPADADAQTRLLASFGRSG